MQNFSTLFGQDAAIGSIRRAYAADRLPHGMIFAGPAGVGKATAAAALAGLFLCERPVNEGGDPDRPEACGRCESCRVFAAGNHPDSHVITKELIRYHDKTGKSKGIDLSIHVLRPELIEPAGRKSAMGRGKVFVIEQADAMNPQAQNAILKTLEEPAGRTIIILLTDQPGALLATIRSRCQVVRFAALPEEMVLAELQKRGVPPSDAADAARLAEGSLGLALKWVQDGVVGPAKELMRQLAEVDSPGAPGQPADLSALPGWFTRAAAAYADKQLARDGLASKDQATREGLALYLRLAAGYYRGQLRASAADPSRARDLERLCNAIDAIARAETYLDGNVNVPVIFQQLALTIGRGAER